mmetsp:Transcript_59969/g.68182  ORF Transcript_59969/g.68182 Transcript_59969/m.68182 type:complete len:299 (+) Transcript_59969:38-934(+)
MSNGSTSDKKIEYLIQKRQSNFSYIQNVLENKAPWMNIVRVHPEEINAFYQLPQGQEKTRSWYFFGLSLGKIADVSHEESMLKKFKRVAEGFESFASSSSSSSSSSTLSRQLSLVQASTTPYIYESHQQQQKRRSTLMQECINSSSDTKKLSTPKKSSSSSSSNGKANKDYIIPNTPIRLKANQVITSLCAMLSIIYNKFMDLLSEAGMYIDDIFKIDNIVKHFFIAEIYRDIDLLAKSLLNRELNSLSESIAGQSLNSQVSTQAVDDDSYANGDLRNPEDIPDYDDTEEGISAERLR